MSITFIGTATITFTGYGTGGGPPTAACDYTTPTGAETGDLLLAFINIFDNLGCVITPPLGWALVPNSRIDHPNGGDDDLTSAAYYWVASGTPAATYAFTIAPPSPTEFDIAGACARGVSSIDAASTNGGFEGTVEATAFDTAENNETLIGFYSIDEVPIVTGPAGYTTLLQNTVSPAGYQWYGLYETLQPTSGSTGTPSVTPEGGYTDWTVILMALIPSSSPAAPTNIFYDSMDF